jgi:hypothetical protein
MNASLTVVEALDALRPQIVTGMMAAMDADPYWQARYGPRGRALAEQDVQYHLDNLTRAVRFELPTSPTHHYRWLQNVLLHRGLCTYHLEWTLDTLSRLLQDLLPEQYPTLQPYLQAGYAGIAYTQDECLALWPLRSAILAAVIEALLEEFTPRPDRLAAWVAARQAEMLLTFSYLLDAVERNQPALFLEHVTWMRRYLPSQGISDAILHSALGLTARQISALLPSGQAFPFTGLLDQVLTTWGTSAR